MTESRLMVRGVGEGNPEERGRRAGLQMARGNWEVLDTFIPLIVVMVPQEYIYVKTLNYTL